jgi:hypothetical protein
MKWTFSSFALIATLVFASGAIGQQLRQPNSVRPVAYNHSYFGYQEEAAPSPSDQPAIPGADMDEQAEAEPADAADAAPVAAAPAGTGCNCTSSCLSSYSGCGSAAGCGCGCRGGLLDCDLGDPWVLMTGENCRKLKIGGWSQTGYHDINTGLFNSHPGKFHQHQAWLYAERAAEGDECNLDWGFRFDLVYGVDAQDTQAFGNPPGTWDYLNGWDHGIYGWALPQAYVEIAGDKWSVIAGKFFTLVGYEVVTAPDNFFYSHALTMYNSEPFTHTGVLSTYSATDDIELYFGWTAGWDTGFERFDDGSNFLGGFSAPLADDLTLTYITTVGNMGVRGDGYSHSVVLDANLTDKLNYVFQSDLVSLSANGGNDEYGINQYLFYTINDCWAVGSRMEWWKADSGFDHGGQSNARDGQHSYYGYTMGVNYRPHANVTVRPEYRWDWSPALDYNNDGFGVDFIVTF